MTTDNQYHCLIQHTLIQHDSTGTARYLKVEPLGSSLLIPTVTQRCSCLHQEQALRLV
jgi:hypothetical protein